MPIPRHPPSVPKVPEDILSTTFVPSVPTIANPPLQVNGTPAATSFAPAMRARVTSDNLENASQKPAQNQMNRITRRDFLESLAAMGLALPISQSLFEVKHPRGLNFNHVNSPTSQKYLIETMGGGVAL